MNNELKKLVELANMRIIFNKRGNILFQVKKIKNSKVLIFPRVCIEDNISIVNPITRESQKVTGLTI